MKLLLSISIFLFTTNFYAQSEVIAGSYMKKYENDDKVLMQKLVLNIDGTFTFHQYDKNYSLTPDKTNERNKYGKGTWKAEKKLIYFYTDKQSDFDEKYTLDFSNTKARFITKSPRDKSDRDIKTSILFYESDIFWVERWLLFKLE